MINNKKVHISLVLIVALNFLNLHFNVCTKSLFAVSADISASNSIPVPQYINMKKPVIKSTIKPEIKSKIIPEIKPQIKINNKYASNTNIYRAPKSGTKTIIKPAINGQMLSNKTEIESVISLTDFVRSFNASYSNTFVATLYALSEAKIEVLSFNSLEGKIYARLYRAKDLYVLIQPFNSKVTLVRITPADGVYNIPDTLVKEFFNNLKIELTVKQSIP